MQHREDAAVLVAVAGSPSLVNTLETYFSTLRSVMSISVAMAWFDRPSAISSSTSRSRSVRVCSGPSSWARESSPVTTSGSSAEPPSATRSSAPTNSSTSATRSLSR